MSETSCSFPKCEMHDFVINTVDHMKEMQETAMSSNNSQGLLLVKLTENLLELQRNNERLQKLFEKMQSENEKRDKKIDDNSKFIYKAIGVLGSLTFISILAPFVIWIIKTIAQSESHIGIGM